MSGVPTPVTVHPRVFVVKDAERDLSAALAVAIKKYALTYGEATSLLAEQLQTLARFQIREERHGTVEEKGGES